MQQWEAKSNGDLTDFYAHTISIFLCYFFSVLFFQHIFIQFYYTQI